MRLVPAHARRRTQRLGALPMTSMIDVVFLLLIFFLVTSDFSLQESELRSSLQTESSGGVPSDLQPQIVDIDIIGGRPTFLIGELATSDRGELVALLRRLPKDQGVAIRASERVPVAAAAAALQAAADAGFQKRSYIAPTAP